jgi:hypothetical protein
MWSSLKLKGSRLSALMDLRSSSKGHSENARCRFPYCELLTENFATVEKTAMERAKKESLTSEAVKQKSAVLIAQFSWCAHAWNVSPEEAARQVVADLFDLLARGGSVSVHVEELGGTEHTLQVRARRSGANS